MKEVNEMTVEDWKAIGVTWNEDGSATIELTKPIKVGAMAKQALVMVCPSLNDAEEFDKSLSKDETALIRERKNMCSLIGLAPEEMGMVKLPDYRRLQRVYTVFLAGTPPLFIGGAGGPRSDSSPDISGKA